MIKYKIITDLNELPNLDPDKPTFMDIETSDLYVGTRLIQLYQEGMEEIIIVDIAPDIKSLSEREDKEKQMVEYMTPLWLVIYNASYDLGTLNFVPNRVDDLFYAVKTAYPQFQEFGLAKVTDKLRYTRGLYDGIDKSEMHSRGFKPGAYLSKAMLRYSAIDVKALELLWEDPKIQNVIENNLAYKVDILSLRYAVQYQQNGLIVDRERVLIETLQAEKDIEELASKLPPNLNVNSPKQVKEYLGTEGSSKEVLVRCDNPDAEVILNLKRRKKELSYLQSIDYDKMVTKFNPAGAISGRFTSSGGALPNGFNSQQIPHRFQYIFTNDTEDTTVIGLDYGTLELRIAASIWGISKMREYLVSGKDLHTEMAKVVTGKELHPDGILKLSNDDWGRDSVNKYITDWDRGHGKSANFGYIFGMSTNMFIQYVFTTLGVKFTEQEAKDIRDKYFSVYKEAAVHHAYVWKNYKKPAFVVETALGRRIKPRRGTDGINIPVQGTGAEVTKLAVHYLIQDYPEVLKYIFNVVHDCIYIRIPKEDRDIWEQRLRTAMMKGWTEMQKTKMFIYKDIPMIVD